MNLEDHAGDILRKARVHAQVTIESAAQAAGLTVGQLEQWEAHGRGEPAPNFGRLAKLIELHHGKLAAIVSGWRPKPVDLRRWRELRQITTAGPDFTVNCYLAWDEATRDAALFDTGFDPAPIFEIVRKTGLELVHLFITHTHADHIAAITPLRKQFPEVRLHSNAKNAPIAQRNREEDNFAVGSLRVAYRATPGHAEDGATYLLEGWPAGAPTVAVVGDALFAGSMGKAFGGADLARRKIREHILSLSSETLLCPGHGPMTTVAEELAHNPFF